MNPTKLYFHLLENPPMLPGGERKRGSSHHDEFWRGYDGQRCMSAPSSFGRAAWNAGRSYRADEEAAVQRAEAREFMRQTGMSKAMHEALEKMRELRLPVVWNRGEDSWTSRCAVVTPRGHLHRFNPRTLRALEKRGLIIAQEEFLRTTFRLPESQEN
jgi:hypothetical protein